MKYLKIIPLLLVFYAVILSLVYIFQNRLLYHPRPESFTPESAGASIFKVVTFQVTDKQNSYGWYASPSVADKPFVLVMFHGNGGIVSDWRYIGPDYVQKLGIGVLVIEYPGYGNNEGTPSEDGILATARASIAWLKEQGIAEDHLIFYGHSMGTGVATAMASEFTNARALLLEAPFSSAVSVARLRFPLLPVDWLMHDQFRSDQRIANVKAPITIVHGDQDFIVPLSEGQKLASLAKGSVSLHIINGGSHIDLYDHGAFKLFSDAINAAITPEKP